MHVLVVEDHTTDFELLRQRLYRSDPSIILTHVKCVADAVKALSQQSFDLLITDLELPDSIGLGTIHRLRKHANDLPIVVYSGNEDADLAMEAVRQGAHDYIPKQPPKGELMTRCLKYAIQRSKWQVQQREHLQEAWLLQQAERLAKEKLKRRDHFLAMLSHELRTPMAAIMAAVELMDLLPDEADSTQPRTVIRRQCKQVAALLEQLLELCRLRQDKVALNFEVVNLKNAAQEAIDAVREKLNRRKHAVELVCDVPQLDVRADAIRLHQVLVNLLANAAKFTPRKGRIIVEIEEQNGMARVHVRDNGVGINDADLSQIFEPFFQASPRNQNSKIAKAKGIGLGLALTRKLVEMQEGTISVSSGDEGTTFSLQFAVAVQQDPVETKEATQFELGNLDIVVVEDDADARQMLEMVLKMHGCNVNSAANGEDGVSLVLEKQPDLVLMDIGLPDITGYEVARKLRLQNSQSPYLIAVTGYGQADDVRRSEEAGINEHLVKPVRTEQLLKKLGEVAQTLAKKP